jgi:lysozyme
MMPTLSDRGVRFVANYEGYVPRPYADAVGWATVGYGHLIRPPHHGVTAGDRAKYAHYDNHDFLALLKGDAHGAQAAVDKYVTVHLNQNENDALVSFTFNVGPEGLRTSTLLRKLNAGDRMGAADEFLKWNKAGGRVLAGLSRRRRAERALFLSHPTHESDGVSFTSSERRWIGEYDHLKAKNKNLRRRRVLRRVMTEQRKRIWRAAQQDGWHKADRRERYHALLARTS